VVWLQDYVGSEAVVAGVTVTPTYVIKGGPPIVN